MGYEFLDHTADVYISASGTSLEEAFENAARATMEVITDPSKIAQVTSIDLKLMGNDLENLLYLWLEEIIARIDADELLFSNFTIPEIKRDDGKIVLSARLFGERFDPVKHEQRQAVKAVTYHMMEITSKDGHHTLKFVLDV